MKRENKILLGAASILLIALPLLATTVLAQMPPNLPMLRGLIQNSPKPEGQGPVPSNLNAKFQSPLRRWILGFLKEASKTQLHGIITTYRGNEIVLTTSTGPLTIMLPQR